MIRMRTWLAGLAIIAVLALPAAALGKTITLGDANDGTYEDDIQGGPGMIVDVKSASGEALGSPVSGTVLSWRVNDPKGKFSIAVLRRKANGDYANRHSSATKKLDSRGAVSPAQRTRLAIHRGDFVALAFSNNAHIGSGAGGQDTSFFPPIAPGTSASPYPYNPYHVGYSAVVRYCKAPDVVGKTLHKAKRHLQNADCTVGKVDKPRRSRPSDVVKSQSVEAGSSVSDAKRIDLKVVHRS